MHDKQWGARRQSAASFRPDAAIPFPKLANTR
jgi:hypothetical protein